MANSGPDTGGSQFFINLKGNHHLDDKHPVFGEVLEGMETVEETSKQKTDKNDRPLQEVTLVRAEIVRE